MKEPKDLTPGELTSLEKIAILRGKCGRYRRALRDLKDHCAPGSTAESIIERALREDAA